MATKSTATQILGWLVSLNGRQLTVLTQFKLTVTRMVGLRYITNTKVNLAVHPFELCILNSNGL